MIYPNRIAQVEHNLRPLGSPIAGHRSQQCDIYVNNYYVGNIITCRMEEALKDVADLYEKGICIPYTVG